MIRARDVSNTFRETGLISVSVCLTILKTGELPRQIHPSYINLRNCTFLYNLRNCTFLYIWAIVLDTLFHDIKGF